jgi:hypothetical protein
MADDHDVGTNSTQEAQFGRRETRRFASFEASALRLCPGTVATIQTTPPRTPRSAPRRQSRELVSSRASRLVRAVAPERLPGAVLSAPSPLPTCARSQVSERPTSPPPVLGQLDSQSPQR